MNATIIMALAIAALQSIVTLIIKTKETAKQNAELTPEQEAEFDKQINETLAQIHWKIE